MDDVRKFIHSDALQHMLVDIVDGFRDMHAGGAGFLFDPHPSGIVQGHLVMEQDDAGRVSAAVHLLDIDAAEPKGFGRGHTPFRAGAGKHGRSDHKMIFEIGERIRGEHARSGDGLKSRAVAVFLNLADAPGCGGGSKDTAASADGVEGKIINAYSWNTEFKERVEAVYDKVDHSSEDGTITYLNDGTEIHWIINPNTDGVYQKKLDEALLKQGSASTDEKVDLFLSETDYVIKYTDAAADVAIPLTTLGIDPDKDLADQYEFTKVVASDADGV